MSPCICLIPFYLHVVEAIWQHGEAHTVKVMMLLQFVMPSHPECYQSRGQLSLPLSALQQCPRTMFFTESWNECVYNSALLLFCWNRTVLVVWKICLMKSLFISRPTKEKEDRGVAWPAGRKRNNWPHQLCLLSFKSAFGVTHMHAMLSRSHSLKTFKQPQKLMLCSFATCMQQMNHKSSRIYNLNVQLLLVVF